MTTQRQSGKSRIARNIKYSAVSSGVTFAASFGLLPFIVSHVGAEIYGAYLLVMTFVGYLGYLDFGILSAVVKYVAEFTGKGDQSDASEVIRASFTFYATVGFLAAALLLLASTWFRVLFGIETASQGVVRQLFQVTAIASVFTWPGKTFDGVLRGLQRYDLLAKRDIAVKMATVLAAYYVFTQGYGIVYFAIASHGLNILGYIMSYVVARSCFRGHRLIGLCFRKEVFRTIFGFGFFVFLCSLTDIAIFQVDNFVVGALISVSAVTLYNVAFTLQGGLRGVNSVLGDPLIPAVAEMEGRNDRHGQEMTLYKATKYMTFVFVPMIIVAIAFARPLILSWMGGGFEASILPAQILMFFWILNGTVQVASGILLSRGDVRVLFGIGALTAVANLAISIVLARYIGMVGVALGTAIPMVLIASPLLLRRSLRLLNVSLRQYYDHAIRANLRTYLLAVVVSIGTMKLLCPERLIWVVLEMSVVYGVVLLAGLFVSLSAAERREIGALVTGRVIARRWTRSPR